MATISVKNVEKRFGSGPAVLRDCNLDLPDHEFLVLVGPSGSGKTTLLRIIAGLEHPTSGDIYFGDRRVNDIDVGDRDIAMVFQNYGLYPHMTVRNNMAFGLRRRKLPRAEIDKKVADAARMLGIEGLLDRRPRQLSGGQRQRVALGRAIVRDPAVFLLDEPLSNLDAHLRLQMRTEILRVHRTVTATTVYVTHDQVEAMTMGDRIAVMHDGLIQQVGPPEDLYDHPVNRFVAGFIGTPAMGFITASVSRDDGALQLRREGVRLCFSPAEASRVALREGGAAVAGVRPEAFRLAPADGLDDHSSALVGVVEVVEPLGPETHLVVDVGGEIVTARVGRDAAARRGEKVTLAVPPGALHLFDPDSGAALL
jgi:multiple sugar transport system ATP-binding protein